MTKPPKNGTHYGDWTVVGPGDYWQSSWHVWCRCKCGAVKQIDLRNLKRGRSKSCASCGNRRRHGNG